ncbi:VOC family protein [Yinghuangia seranimata]|uniref:VOC family protein n=1 Tax=Yinghuangia seranimata TaxID=408067 RepID=UPI00248D0608|nr:VOC family protein [Yinghuangia seranimata]MDI2126488.1 VOC family protein [Yinghuangia seranimata]
MSVRIGAVSIDTNDLAAATAFWTAATGYAVDSGDDSYTYLTDPDKSGPGLCLNVVPEPRVGKNRLHLELYVDDLTAEAERLEGLGATRVARHGEDSGGWIVFADNEGNQFCVSVG